MWLQVISSTDHLKQIAAPPRSLKEVNMEKFIFCLQLTTEKSILKRSNIYFDYYEIIN